RAALASHRWEREQRPRPWRARKEAKVSETISERAARIRTENHPRSTGPRPSPTRSFLDEREDGEATSSAAGFATSWPCPSTSIRFVFGIPFANASTAARRRCCEALP